ncbi:NEUFC protein, partial [Amia calva]|nr:NEUFC protein [Amia calva]
MRYLLAVIFVAVGILIFPYSRNLIEINLPRGIDFIFKAWSSQDSTRVFRQEELGLYNGQPGSRGLYLSIVGQVFDVSKGRKHYGPGGSYHFFAGRDASQAFVTGDFTDAGLVDDVSGLSPLQMVALFDWLSFYQKDYVLVGRLTGRFYSETGEATGALRQAEAALAEGLKLKAQAEAENQLFPSCNSEWSSASGGRVWCSTRSGGVHRDWVGVPRRMFKPGLGGSRCVCVRTGDTGRLDHPSLQEYEGCPSLAESCAFRD